MLDFINRVRKFDYKELTPTQIILGVAAVIVVLWLISQVVSLLLALAPVAAVGIGLYFGYQWLNSRDEDIPDEMTQSNAEKSVNEALANVEKVEAAQREETARQTAEMPEQPQEAASPMQVEQVVNPETGFKEPDISRLIEKEEERLREADRVNDEVMSQLEERRRRLLNQQQSDDESA